VQGGIDVDVDDGRKHGRIMPSAGRGGAVTAPRTG